LRRLLLAHPLVLTAYTVRSMTAAAGNQCVPVLLLVVGLQVPLLHLLLLLLLACCCSC
jgi:hypothetical protein